MKIASLVEKYHLPQSICDILHEHGIHTLNPPQQIAIEKGLLLGKNLVLAVPTASGKTLMAELCMLKTILSSGLRALYIAPLKALASEKFNDFKQKYERLGISIGIATGDLDSPSKFLDKYQILIATAEKIDSLLRAKSSWLINNLGVVVIDEIHVIDDDHRGPTLEILTTRLRQMKPDLQILGLSATISNAKELAGWLNAELASSHWRPIPLNEGVFYNNRIMFNNDTTRVVHAEQDEDLNNLTLDTLRGGGQVLVFVNSRRSAQAASRELCPTTSLVLKDQDKQILHQLSQEIGDDPSATKICKKLADCIKHGSAFHHAGLKPRQRHLIEDYFRKNIIKVIASTPTLAAGINLPARRAIIRDCKRFASGMGSVYIPVSEYKQCAGRAGRPQYDDHGEAVLMAKSLSEQHTLYEKFVLAKPEPISSKLGSESSLRMHVLSSIAAGYVHDINGMFDFMNQTFLAYQQQSSNLLILISNIFEYLHQNGFIEKSGFRFFTTPFGATTSRLYIDPTTALTLRQGLAKIYEGKSFSTYGLLHLLACTPDSEILNVGKSDYEELESLAMKIADELIFTPEEFPSLQDAYTYYATLKTMWLLARWIHEEKEDSLCDEFNVGPGDIYRHVESAEWLLYAAGTIAQLYHYKKLTFDLEKLRKRMRYGIQEELLELTALQGIGRVRARILFKHGLTKFSDFSSISQQHLAAIKSIGPKLAQDILKQIHQPIIKNTPARFDWQEPDAPPEDIATPWTD